MNQISGCLPSANEFVINRFASESPTSRGIFHRVNNTVQQLSFWSSVKARAQAFLITPTAFGSAAKHIALSVGHSWQVLVSGGKIREMAAVFGQHIWSAMKCLALAVYGLWYGFVGALVGSRVLAFNANNAPIPLSSEQRLNNLRRESEGKDQEILVLRGNIEALEKERDELNQRRDRLADQLRVARDPSSPTLSQYQDLKAAFVESQQHFAAIQTNLTAVETQLAQNEARYVETQQQLERERRLRAEANVQLTELRGQLQQARDASRGVSNPALDNQLQLIEELQKRNNELEAQLQEVTTAFNDSKTQSHQTQGELEKKIQELKAETELLRLTIEGDLNATEVMELKQQLTDKDGQIRDLSERLEAKSQQSSHAQNALEHLQKEKAELVAAMNARPTCEEMTALKEEKETKEFDAILLKRDKELLEKEKAMFDEKYKGELDEKQRELRELKGEMQVKAQTYQQQLKEKNDQQQKLKSEYQEQLALLRDKQTELEEKYKKSIGAEKQKGEELTKMREELAQAKREKQQAVERLSNIEADARAFEEAQSQIEKSKKTIEQLQQQIKRLQENQTQVDESYAKEITAVRSAQKHLQLAFDEQVKSLRQKEKDSEKTKQELIEAQRAAEELASSLRKKTEEYINLEFKLQQLEFENQKENQKLTDQIEAESKKLADMMSLKDEIKALCEKNQVLLAEIERQKQLDLDNKQKYDEKIGQLNDQIIRYQVVNQDLEAQLLGITETVQALKSQLAKKNEALEEIREDLARIAPSEDIVAEIAPPEDMVAEIASRKDIAAEIAPREDIVVAV